MSSAENTSPFIPALSKAAVASEYSYLVKIFAESVENLEEFIDASMEYGQPSTLISPSSPVTFRPIGDRNIM